MSENCYRLLDSGGYQKLEVVGPYRFVRPCPQAIWSRRLPDSEWQRYDARYERFSGGQGKWHMLSAEVQSEWPVELGGIKLLAKPTDFGHLGFFVEHKDRWTTLQSMIATAGGPFNVLNLFGYTGAASIACLVSGAEVVHVDASKTSVSWGRENAHLNEASDKPVRWIVDDARKFVQREIRRGNRYKGIILDPPSYGRGAKGEVWKIEQDLLPLLENVVSLLSDDFSFLLLSSHSNGHTPQALANLFSEYSQCVVKESGEMLIPESGAVRAVPSGAYALVANRNDH